MMAEENTSGNRTSGQGGAKKSADEANESGDPGRTPGTAEGDRETVEADLRDKEGEQPQKA